MTMNVNVAQTAFAVGIPATERRPLIDYVASREFDRPTLVLDINAVANRYHALKRGLGDVNIHYAVKANPEREVISRLVAEGSRFDAASRGEIELCLSLGARPSEISFGNTVKRASDIAFAYQAGLTLFAADSDGELVKIARNAPGSEVYIRLLIEESEADWPLSRKFGTTGEEAIRLMGVARNLGLQPVGISFHVGSQTRDPAMWNKPLAFAAGVWHKARMAGFDLDLLNIGGGFPAFYGEAMDDAETYAGRVMTLVRDLFGRVPRIMAEPGRGLVAEAGLIVAEVMLVSKKRPEDDHRWVYLDIGKFSGLAETMDEAIRYQFQTSWDGTTTGPCILAGPSCDSADVLYEKRPVQLPLALSSGDRVLILACGAYTSSYSSVGFNGFPPLDVVCI
jgi:ornithine decarboxylase